MIRRLRAISNVQTKEINARQRREDKYATVILALRSAFHRIFSHLAVIAVLSPHEALRWWLLGNRISHAVIRFPCGKGFAFERNCQSEGGDVKRVARRPGAVAGVVV